MNSLSDARAPSRKKTSSSSTSMLSCRMTYRSSRSCSASSSARWWLRRHPHAPRPDFQSSGTVTQSPMVASSTLILSGFAIPVAVMCAKNLSSLSGRWRQLMTTTRSNQSVSVFMRCRLNRCRANPMRCSPRSSLSSTIRRCLRRMTKRREGQVAAVRAILMRCRCCRRTWSGGWIG